MKMVNILCNRIKFDEIAVRNHVFNFKTNPNFDHCWLYLLRPWKRWRSIVMSTFVCLSVCLSMWLSARISPESHARSLPLFLCVAYVAVDRSSCGRVTKSQGKGSILGFSSPLTVYCKICNTFAQEGSAYRPGRGWWWERTARLKCDVRLPCYGNCYLYQISCYYIRI